MKHGLIARRIAVVVLGVGGLLSLSVSGQAQVTQPAAPPAPGEFRFPEFATVVKDMQASSGLFTIYRQKSDDPTKDQTKLYCQIPRSLLKQDLLLATSFSRGEMAGFQGTDYLVRFEMTGRRVMISVPDVRFVQTPGQPVTDAVSRTYTSGFLAAMPIVTLAPGGDPVVDLGVVLTSGGIAGGGMMNARRDLCEFTKVKVFPDNALIDVDMAMAGPGGSGSTMGVTYAFRRLPSMAEYKPRLADERVGYFTTVRQDWNIKHSEKENIIRYVNRWDVKKKDASLELSPPEKPIVFVIERTVPLQWRKYVAEGIADWNKAYERLGIVGAIVVQQQTDDNEFANVDPEDARYNFIRWIVTGRAFAMGPSRADPRTGQILDADIIFDDSMLRHRFGEFDVFGPGPVAAMMGPDLTEFLTANPQFIPAGQTVEQVKAAAKEMSGEMLVDAPANGHGLARNLACSYAVGLKHQLSMLDAAAAAVAPGKKIPDRLIGESIKHIVSHEVGHTLGLRHNFKGSAWLSMEEVRRRRDNTDDALFGSVMDYNPLLFFAGDEPGKVRHIASPTVGPYDLWAIEYGYKQPGREDGDEKAMLAKIASQCTKRENAYATDEDTMGLTSADPMSNRWDMSDDPIAWAKMRVELADALLKDIRKWAIKGDEPNHYLKETFATLMFEKSRNMLYVSRLVGGQIHNRNRSGDPESRPALVLLDPKKQRAALAAISETVLRDDFFLAEAELYNELGPSRWMDWASSTPMRLDFPIHQVINSMQAYSLMNLCAPQVLQRVYDAELKSKAEDKFTAAELIVTVRDTVWSGLTLDDGAKYTNAKPKFSSIRRNLQRQHLAYMLGIVDSESGRLVSPDLQDQVKYSLRELNEEIGNMLDKAEKPGASAKLDFATRAHLSECKSEIYRVLNAPHIKFPEQRGMMINILRADQKVEGVTPQE
ncbi:MAG TPA: zinc-dependent metalloprotease [Tepidisphaeraceae bacterium]|nr:zinc-dependent metalloprotease [Tepidisphaeraceae bacterium]